MNVNLTEIVGNPNRPTACKGMKQYRRTFQKIICFNQWVTFMENTVLNESITNPSTTIQTIQ